MHHLALPGNVILLWPLNLCLMEDSSNLLHLSSETKPEYIRYEYKLRDWFTICSRKYFLIFRRTSFSIKFFYPKYQISYIFFIYTEANLDFCIIFWFTRIKHFLPFHIVGVFNMHANVQKSDAINILKYRNGSLPPDVSLWKCMQYWKKLPNIRINETNI